MELCADGRIKRCADGRLKRCAPALPCGVCVGETPGHIRITLSGEVDCGCGGYKKVVSNGPLTDGVWLLPQISDCSYRALGNGATVIVSAVSCSSWYEAYRYTALTLFYLWFAYTQPPSWRLEIELVADGEYSVWLGEYSGIIVSRNCLLPFGGPNSPNYVCAGDYGTPWKSGNLTAVPNG